MRQSDSVIPGLALLAVSILVIPSAAAAPADRPNILFVLVDDMAWADAGCYGHPWHQTPNIDALAREGMRFTRGYAPAPICSASRASILTGKTTARLNFEFVTKSEPGHQKIDGNVPLIAPEYTLNLPLPEKTIPEFLSDLNYRTGFFGKWHLNVHHQRYLGWSPTHGPRQQGFSVAVEDFGSHPYAWGKSKPPLITMPGKYPDDTMIQRACGFLRESGNQPFFLMVSTFHVHTPVKTRCQWLLDHFQTVVPSDSPRRAPRVAYAAFLQQLDHHIGELLAAVDEAGLRDSTMVVLMSDNGGHPEFTGNGPLRGSKWNLYEGGIRVPFLVRWPNRIAPGTVCDTPVIGYDLLPTFVALAGGTATDSDGRDISPLFSDPTQSLSRDLLWHFPYYHPETGYPNARQQIGVDDFAVSQTRPQSALLSGDDKLLKFYETDEVELYDLSRDVSEQNNLVPQNEQRARQIRQRLDQRLREAGARLPMPKGDQ